MISETFSYKPVFSAQKNLGGAPITHRLDEPTFAELKALEPETNSLLHQNHVGDKTILKMADRNDMVGLYLKEIGRTPLLTAKEEISLGKRISLAKDARESLVKHLVHISRRKKQKLQGVIDDGLEAQSHLVRANTRLVVSLAKKAMEKEVPFLDLIQEGNIGLIRAAGKYDYRRGYRFSTYATWWIRQSIGRALAGQDGLIHKPYRLNRKMRRWKKFADKFRQDQGREPSADEIAAQFGTRPQKVNHATVVFQSPLSLNEQIDRENPDSDELQDGIKDSNSSSFEEETEMRILWRRVAPFFDKLPPREARILRLRYGLADGKGHALREIGQKLGFTYENARLLEIKALQKLKIFLEEENNKQ